MNMDPIISEAVKNFQISSSNDNHIGNHTVSSSAASIASISDDGLSIALQAISKRIESNKDETKNNAKKPKKHHHHKQKRSKTKQKKHHSQQLPLFNNNSINNNKSRLSDDSEEEMNILNTKFDDNLLLHHTEATESDYKSSEDDIIDNGLDCDFDENVNLLHDGYSQQNKPLLQSSKTAVFLPISDDDDDDDDEIGDKPELHQRSYSESNLQKKIQENQWPSSASSEELFDENEEDSKSKTSNDAYSRYVTMKKKYKTQRRISKQFQDAITSIQDENEDSMIQTEHELRKKFEKEYEMKLIQLEHQKLNNAMHIEGKMKQLLSQNDELMQQNKQLQQQISAQVSMIQQQQITLHQQSLVRMQSESMTSPISVASPLAALANYPSTHSLNLHVLPTTNNCNSHGHSNNDKLSLRRISNGSTKSMSIPTIPSNTMHHNGSGNGLNLNNIGSTTSVASQDDNYTLNMNVLQYHSNQFSNDSGSGSGSNDEMNIVDVDDDNNDNVDDEDEDDGLDKYQQRDDGLGLEIDRDGDQEHGEDDGDDEQHGHGDDHGDGDGQNQVENSLITESINSGDDGRKHNEINMEISHKYKLSNTVSQKSIISAKSKSKSKRKKLHDLETRLLQKDDEIKQKIGNGLSTWDRFWHLMTPSFCSCSPNQQHTAKSIDK